MKKKWIIFILLPLLLNGCYWLKPQNKPIVHKHVVRHSEVLAKQWLQLGQYYQEHNRFELARETFLHGLAVTQSTKMREVLKDEIEATDKLILSNR